MSEAETIPWAHLWEKYEAGAGAGAEADANADPEPVVPSITSLPSAAPAAAGSVMHSPKMLAVLGESAESEKRRDLARVVRGALVRVELDLDGRFDVREALEKGAMPVLDSDFAPLVRDVFGREMCFVSELDVFRTWDGQVWRDDAKGQYVHAALLMLQREYQGVLGEIVARVVEGAREDAVAAGLGGADLESAAREARNLVGKALEPYAKAARGCVTSVALNAVRNLLRTLPGFVRGVDDFDVLPSLSVPGSCVVVFRNGWVDFGSVVAGALSGRGWEMPLRGFTSDLLVTQSCAASWAGEGWEDSLWGAYLLKVWPDAETREMVLRYLGMCMLGLAPELKFLLVLKGDPDSGKSLLLEVVKSVLGDYAGSMSIASLMQPSHQRSGSEHSVDLHRHRLSRFVISTEPSERSVWNTSLVKALTGGDSAPTRGLREGVMMEWAARMGLAVATNDWPRFRAGDEAMEKRVLAAETVFRFVRDWDEKTPEALRADPSYKDRLLASEAERGAVLASLVWGVRRAVDSAAAGGRWVVPSAASRAARAGMMTELSSLREVVGMLLDAGLVRWVAEEDRVRGRRLEWSMKSSELRSVYERVCKARGMFYVKSNTDWARESAWLSSVGKARQAPDPVTGRENAQRVLDLLEWVDTEDWARVRALGPGEKHWSVEHWLLHLDEVD